MNMPTDTSENGLENQFVGFFVEKLELCKQKSFRQSFLRFISVVVTGAVEV